MFIMRKYILSLLAICGAWMAFASDQFPTITTAQLEQAISHKSVVLLDVNGTASWTKAHIPGAMDFTAMGKELAARLPADKNALIVAYCGNEQCPAYRAAAQAALKLGYTNVKHYARGIQGWIKDGGATAKGS
jgi:rhodanese-related sulfurtransferase